MSKYKIKDIIVIIIAALIFFIAIYFMLNSGGAESDKTKPKATELVTEPDFNDSYDELVIEKIALLTDFGSINIQNICKGDLFFMEDPLPEGSACFALQKLGVLDTQINSNKNDDTDNLNAEGSLRNSERDAILKLAKDAIDSYKTKNGDYPESAKNKQLSELLKSGGSLSTFLATGSKTDDPSAENTRLCYAKRSATQYWLYYIAEPNSAPKDCTSEDPKDIKGAVDFSLR